MSELAPSQRISATRDIAISTASSSVNEAGERGGSQIAGFLLARRWTEAPVGFVDILAVHPDHQREGIGTTLLAEAFRLFPAAGLEEAQLGVGSTNPHALRLYERLGMTPRFRYDT